MQSSPSWTAFSSGGLTEEESPSKLIQVAGRLCVLVALLLRGPSFLSGVGYRPVFQGKPPILEVTSIPCHMGSSSKAF